MRKSWKMIVAAIIIALVLNAGLTAQSFSTSQSSRASTASMGLFGNDVDDFLSYHDYGDVEFDRWFSYAGWRSTLLSAGYARWFGGIYAGLAYTGNIVQTSNVTSTKNNTATWNILGVNTQTVTREWDQNTWAAPRNQIDVLVGVAGMGFKVGFAEDLRVTDNPAGTSSAPINQITSFPDSKDAEHRNIVDSYRNIDGFLAPYVGWGMNLGLGGLTIRPYVDVALEIHQEEFLDIRKNFNTIDGAVQGEQISVINAPTTGINPNGYENYIRPYADLGADVVLIDNGSVEIDAGLGYGINFQLYSNDFDVFGISGSTAGRVNSLSGTYRITQGTYGAGEYQNVAANLTEESYIFHRVSPNFAYYQNLADNVKVGVNIAPSFSIESIKTLSWAETTTKNYTAPTYQGANRVSTVVVATTGKTETATTTFEFTPAISGGVTCTLIPNRFVVNAGLRAGISYTNSSATTKPGGFTRIVTTTTDSDGNVTQTVGSSTNPTTFSDSVATQSYWSGLNGTASGGFTLYFTPKFFLDTAFSTATSGYTIYINQVSVLFSLKN